METLKQNGGEGQGRITEDTMEKTISLRVSRHANDYCYFCTRWFERATLEFFIKETGWVVCDGCAHDRVDSALWETYVNNGTIVDEPACECCGRVFKPGEKPTIAHTINGRGKESDFQVCHPCVANFILTGGRSPEYFVFEITKSD